MRNLMFGSPPSPPLLAGSPVFPTGATPRKRGPSSRPFLGESKVAAPLRCPPRNCDAPSRNGPRRCSMRGPSSSTRSATFRGARNVAAKAGSRCRCTSPTWRRSRVSEWRQGSADGALLQRAVLRQEQAPAEELLGAGFHQRETVTSWASPVWRALGGVCEIEAAGLRHVLSQDRTAVLLDVREAEEFRKGTLPGARSIPRSLVLEGKDVASSSVPRTNGRLPMEDHNTRVIVVGADAAAARYVAEAIAREAFHNVAYFRGHSGRSAVGGGALGERERHGEP